jgi:hypothetical protein
MDTRRRLLPILLATALPLLAGGCLAAAAGAGAAGGLYFTSRGVGRVVDGSIDQATAATRQAFTNLHVTFKGQKDADDGSRQVFGDAKGEDVTVDLEEKTDVATKVEVSVKTSAVTWDKDMAQKILDEVRRLRQGRG